jgi:hypothetical protein
LVGNNQGRTTYLNKRRQNQEKQHVELLGLRNMKKQHTEILGARSGNKQHVELLV